MMRKKYTLTVYIAAPGTPLTDDKGQPLIKNGKQEHSMVGHVYYKISDGTENGTRGYGFAPLKDGDPFGPGKVYDNEYLKYKGPVYARQLEISEAQYKKLSDYGDNPKLGGFDDKTYNGLNNSCIDFVYGGLAYAGIYNPPKTKIQLLNRTLFEKSYEGTVKVKPNADEFDKIPYQIGNEKNPLNTPPNERRHENPSCAKAFGFSWKTGVCWLSENQQHQEQQIQYAQARSLTFDNMPPLAQELCQKCQAKLEAYYQKHNIHYSQDGLERAALAAGVAAYGEKMTDLTMLNIKDGNIYVGHKTPQGVLNYASVNEQTAAATPEQDSIAQSKQAERDLALAAEQRQQEILAYQQSQSMGRSM